MLPIDANSENGIGIRVHVQSAEIRGTIHGLAHKQIQRVQHVEYYGKRNREKMEDACAVLVVNWDIIPEHAQLCILKREEANVARGSDYARIVKNPGTTSKPVRSFIQNVFPNASEG